ncbi:MAG: YbcC family protein [Leptospirillum sp.]
MENILKTQESQILESAENACRLIAPLWPLKNFVAVNPYQGFGNRPFKATELFLSSTIGSHLHMPVHYYLDKIRDGQITLSDISEVLQNQGSSLSAEDFLEAIKQHRERSAPPDLLTDCAMKLDNQNWPSFVIERISHFCAGYFDEGQAYWSSPWSDQPLYRAWKEYATIDFSPAIMGLKLFRERIRSIPDAPEETIVHCVQALNIPPESLERYLFALLSSVGGWASWARYQNWQAGLEKKNDNTPLQILSIRIAWDYLLLESWPNSSLREMWMQSLAAWETPDVSDTSLPSEGMVLQEAHETSYRKTLFNMISSTGTLEQKELRPVFQAAFCIDVRSEIIRRAIESLAPNGQTLGFAGFFGVPLEFLPFASVAGKKHLPILFPPSYRIQELPVGIPPDTAEKWAMIRRRNIRLSKTWKIFKTSPASCFSYVESFGLFSFLTLVSNSLGWSRPAPHPDKKGLRRDQSEKMAPVLDNSLPDTVGKNTGIPLSDRARLGTFILKNMGLTKNFARLVLLLGHGSTTTNNPQATGLDCGACGGQTGEVSARIAAALLNDPETRRSIAADKQVVIPDDTVFLPALHDTTTDQIRLFDTGQLPDGHRTELRSLEKILEEAGQRARQEKAPTLGLNAKSHWNIMKNLQKRTRDWAQTRPEWGLGRNAAFIAAPRVRTRALNLDGRVFLHEYDWRQDPDFSTLELIISAPLLVANWINMQYFASTVDNERYGSGNKVLHNVVGGSIGVLEGNGGDLRQGLSIQSIHDGRRWIHDPLRLHALLEAPSEPILQILKKHDNIRNLVLNEWILLYRLDDTGKSFRMLPSMLN